VYCLGRGVLRADRVVAERKHRLALVLNSGGADGVGGRAAGSAQPARRKASVVTAGVTLELWVGAASAELAADILVEGVTLALAEVGEGVPAHRSRERVCRVLLEEGAGSGGVVAWGLEGGALNRRERVDRLQRIDALGAGVFEVEGQTVALRLRCCAIPGLAEATAGAGEEEETDGSSFVEVCAWLQALEARILQQLQRAIAAGDGAEVAAGVTAPAPAKGRAEARRTSYAV